MLYFDNAATGGQKPDSVISSVLSSIKVCANAGRSGHKLSLSCANAVLEARKILCSTFGGENYEKVIFTKNCTEALNIAIVGLLHKGDHVVTTCMEHNSVLRPLEKLRKCGNISYDICPIKNGNIDSDDFCSLIKPNTKMAIITSASNVSGVTPDLKKIKLKLPQDILFVVDGAQGGGHIPLQCKEIGIDALALAGHKGLMGIQGSGALILSNRVNPLPILYGGTGSESFSLAMPSFYPDALESGTLSFPAIISLSKGAEFYSNHEKSIRKQLLSYTSYFIDKLSRIKGYKIFSIPNACGIVSFSGILQSEWIAEELSEKYDIAVRGGLHCAPLMHKALHTNENGLIRVSFSIFNERAEIDELLSALKKIALQNRII